MGHLSPSECNVLAIPCNQCSLASSVIWFVVLRVCVCPPLDQGFRPTDPPTTCTTTDSQAGACDTLLLSHATKLWRRVGRETWPVSCTCDATVDQAVPLSAFCFMVFHATTPKQFFLSHFQQPRVLQLVTAVKGNNHCSNTYNFSDFSPCCSTAILPIVVTCLLYTSPSPRDA